MPVDGEDCEDRDGGRKEARRFREAAEEDGPGSCGVREGADRKDDQEKRQPKDWQGENGLSEAPLDAQASVAEPIHANGTGDDAYPSSAAASNRMTVNPWMMSAA